MRTAFAANLKQPVRLLVFGAAGCASCQASVQFVQEVAAASDWITAERYDLNADSSTVAQYAVDKVPAIVVVGQQDSGIRYFGLPSGLEFPTFLNTIIDVSRGDIRLSANTIQYLKSVREPVHIEVFFSPTCPACTEVVALAQRFALVNSLIRADAISVREFSALYESYDPSGTPATLVNGITLIEGNMSEQEFLRYLLSIVQ